MHGGHGACVTEIGFATLVIEKLPVNAVHDVLAGAVTCTGVPGHGLPSPPGVTDQPFAMKSASGVVTHWQPMPVFTYPLADPPHPGNVSVLMGLQAELTNWAVQPELGGGSMVSVGGGCPPPPAWHSGHDAY